MQVTAGKVILRTNKAAEGNQNVLVNDLLWFQFDGSGLM